LSETTQLSTEVIYLGFTLDKGLTWKKQWNKVTNKEYRAFWTCRCTFGKTSGLRPKVLHLIFTMVVKSCAATVWQPTVKFKMSRVELRKLPSLAFLGITGPMRMISGAGGRGQSRKLQILLQ
jgi:hypothetical protein